jgi:hypothetical protein
MRNDQLVLFKKETEESICSCSRWHSAFPNIFCTNKFLEILEGNTIQVSYKPKNPKNFLSILAFQRSNDLLSWAFPIFCAVKFYGSRHAQKITHRLTFEKEIFSIVCYAALVLL